MKNHPREIKSGVPVTASLTASLTTLLMAGHSQRGRCGVKESLQLQAQPEVWQSRSRKVGIKNGNESIHSIAYLGRGAFPFDHQTVLSMDQVELKGP